MTRLLLGAILVFGTMVVPSVGQDVAINATTVRPIVSDDDPYEIPETVIVAPNKAVRRGHQIVFGVQTSKVKPKNLAATTYVWIVTPKVEDMFTWPDNTKGSFGTGDSLDPTHYDLTLVASYVFTTEDGKYAATRTVESSVAVEVVDRNPTPLPVPVPVPDPVKPTPTPAPTPGPAPVPPDPTLPDGRFGLAKFMNGLVQAMPSDQRKALALSYRTSASSMAAGAFKTKAEAILAVAEGNTVALGVNLNAWKPVLDQLDKHLNQVKATIASVADFKVACEEIAQGLEAGLPAPKAAVRSTR
jgi:hypothetical protein